MKAIKSVAPIIVFFAVAVVFFATVVGLGVFSSDNELYYDAVPDTGMVYNRMDVTVDWNDDRTCTITQHIEAEFLDNGYAGGGTHGIYVDIPVNSGEKIRGLDAEATGYYNTDVGKDLPCSVDHEFDNAIVRVLVGDEDRVFYKGGRVVCDLEYEYITPVHPEGKDILDINAIGYGWMSMIAEATVKVTYPYEINRGDVQVVTSNGNHKTEETVEINYGGDGKSINVGIANLLPFHGVRVKYTAPAGAVVNRTDVELIVTAVIASVLVAAAILLMIFAGKDKPLSPIVDFYPPRIDGADGNKRHMLPVQMGMIIDGHCSDEDITSLIFYWASEGYLQIDDSGSSTALIKLKELDPVTPYEKVLFDRLFGNGVKLEDGKKRVTLSSLKGNFAQSIQNAKTAVNAEYSGKLYTKGGNILSVAMLVIAAILGLAAGMLSSFRVAMGYVNVVGVAVLIPVFLSWVLSTLIMNYYVKLSKTKRRLMLVGLFVTIALLATAVMFLVPGDVMSLAERIIFGVAISVVSGLAPFMTRRTDFYTDRLNEIVGFRDFLRDAEKDRLEALVKDDPQYYYNILPYANVLGVSDVLSDKFKDITIEPPTYYSGRNVTVFDVLVINRLCRSMGNDLTYRPPSSGGGGSRGSFSGGGGGGGGGFGGGGGGRW